MKEKLIKPWKTLGQEPHDIYLQSYFPLERMRTKLTQRPKMIQEPNENKTLISIIGNLTF